MYVVNINVCYFIDLIGLVVEVCIFGCNEFVRVYNWYIVECCWGSSLIIIREFDVFVLVIGVGSY